MHQFCQAPDALLADLEQRATGRCVQFHNRQLPPGAMPQRARIGFEVDQCSGSAALLVQKGIRYGGQAASVRQWLQDGSRVFSNWQELCAWLRTDLAGAFSMQQPECDLPGVTAHWCQHGGGLPLVGREAIVEQIEATLCQRLEPQGIVLVGPTAAGKTAICREVAARWPNRHPGGKTLRVELASVLAGTHYPGERSGRLQQLYQHLARLGPSALVVIENIHLGWSHPAGHTQPLATGRPRRSPEDPLAALALGGAVEAGVHILGTTTPRGLRALKNVSLRRRLVCLTVEQPTWKEMMDCVLPQVARQLESTHHVEIPRESLLVALKQTTTGQGGQPAAAIGLLEHAAIQVAARGSKILGPDDVVGPA